MSTKTIVIACVVCLVAVIGYVFLTAKSHEPAQNEAQAGTFTNPTTQSPTTLSALIGTGLNQLCTFSGTSDGNELSGKVYVGSGKARADFESKLISSGKTTRAHVLTEGAKTSMWQDGESMGMIVESNIQNDTSMQASQTVSLDASTPLLYACKPWVVDSQVFVLPQNVMFHSMADMMQMSAPSSGVNGNAIAPVR